MSARVYEQECDELMHRATTLTTADTVGRNIEPSRMRSWGVVARVLMMMIIAAVVGDHSVTAEGDEQGLEDVQGDRPSLHGAACSYDRSGESSVWLTGP